MRYGRTNARNPDTTIDKTGLSIQQYIDETKQRALKAAQKTADDFNNTGFNNGGFGSSFRATSMIRPEDASQFHTSEEAALNADPWGYYRPGAADNLAKFAGQEDPSNIFRSKLTQMASGQFSPDDPSYKWRLEQGQQAVERSLGARGLLNSGNAAIELQQYGQGAASQEYAAQFSRLLQGMQGVESQYNSQFSRLSQMAGISLDPTAQGKIDAGLQQASMSANAQMSAAASSAAGNVAAASASQASGLARVGLDREINNQQQARYAAYDKGLGDALSGKSA